MSDVRHRTLAALVALVVGSSVAAALDASGVVTLGRHRTISVLAATIAGCLVAGAGPALLRRRTSARLVTAGGLVAGAATFVLVHLELGWLDLGAFGAGTPTQLPLLVAPAVSVLVALSTWPGPDLSAER